MPAKIKQQAAAAFGLAGVAIGLLIDHDIAQLALLSAAAAGLAFTVGR